MFLGAGFCVMPLWALKVEGTMRRRDHHHIAAKVSTRRLDQLSDYDPDVCEFHAAKSYNKNTGTSLNDFMMQSKLLD